MKIAILSDIHAVACSFEMALAEAGNEGFDRLLILGDLLTYGVDPERTLELTAEAAVRYDAKLILGNHDQLYLDLIEGKHDYYDRLSGWVRETVDWTYERIDNDLLKCLPWEECWSSGALFVAHANPYQFGDWTYLRTEQEMRWACRILAKRGYKWGLFGHTHRRAQHIDRGHSAFTVGSLGQPRDRDDKRLQWTLAELRGDVLSLEPRYVDFDVKAHLAAIESTTMNRTTKKRISGYFN